MRRLPRRLGYGEEASLVEHLGELRARLVICLIAVVAGFAVAYAFHEEIIRYLNEPLPARHRKPVTFGVAEPFITSVMVSLWAGLVGAMPVCLYQLWSFLAPAFQQRTQRTVAGLSLFAAVLAAGGILFGYFVALPAAVHFLTNYDSSIYAIQIRARDYYNFAALVLVAVAVVFELPIFILGLVRVGVLTPAKLRRNRRLGYVLMAALAVALPGVDPVTTFLEMLPLWLLFEGSIWMAAFFDRRWRPERYGDLAQEPG